MRLWTFLINPLLQLKSIECILLGWAGHVCQVKLVKFLFFSRTELTKFYQSYTLPYFSPLLLLPPCCVNTPFSFLSQYRYNLANVHFSGFISYFSGFISYMQASIFSSCLFMLYSTLSVKIVLSSSILLSSLEVLIKSLFTYYILKRCFGEFFSDFLPYRVG